VVFFCLLSTVVLVLLCLREVLRTNTCIAFRRYLDSSELNLGSKCKIMIGFYIITTKVGTIYLVDLPPQIAAFLSNIGDVVSVGIWSTISIPLHCTGATGYIPKLVFFIVAPFSLGIIIVLCVIAYALATSVAQTMKEKTAKTGSSDRTNNGSAKESTAVVEAQQKARVTVGGQILQYALPLLLKTLFVAYPLVTQVAFEAWPCYNFAEGGWLIADVKIVCGSSQHRSAQALAYIAIALYPVGSIIVVAALLLSVNGAISRQQDTPLSKALSFLHWDLKPAAFYWELCEMLRRLLLVGVFQVAFEPGSMQQVVAATILSAVYLFIQLVANPYKLMADGLLASSCSFCVLIIFLCSVLYKIHTFTLSDTIRHVMSAEERAQMALQNVDLVCMFSVIGSLMFGLVILVIQVVVHKRQQRLAATKRLSYNKAPVQLSDDLPEGKRFHLFLSHVWGTGQDVMRNIKQLLKDMVPGIRCFLDVDDLENIEDLEKNIGETVTILVYASRGYFTSKNCMRELTHTVHVGKPLICVIEPDPTRGGLSRDEVKEQLECAKRASYDKWGFAKGTTPDSGALYNALYERVAPIEWNRLHPFQAVTVRMIAVRTYLNMKELANETVVEGKLMVEAEIINQPLSPLPKLSRGQNVHIYCSKHNPPGAYGLIDIDLRQVLGGNDSKKLYSGELVTTKHDSGRLLRTPSLKRSVTQTLTWGRDSELQTYKHMLLYLTSETWTRGEETSKNLEQELKGAMENGIHILMVHEMNGGDEKDNKLRSACEFGQFFDCERGATPSELLSRGIYRDIAQPLKGPGDFRKASLMQLAQTLAVAIKPATTTSRTLLKTQADCGPATSKRRSRWSTRVSPDIEPRSRWGFRWSGSKVAPVVQRDDAELAPEASRAKESDDAELAPDASRAKESATPAENGDVRTSGSNDGQRSDALPLKPAPPPILHEQENHMTITGASTTQAEGDPQWREVAMNNVSSTPEVNRTELDQSGLRRDLVPLSHEEHAIDQAIQYSPSTQLRYTAVGHTPHRSAPVLAKSAT